jgi:hypothetical protein
MLLVFPVARDLSLLDFVTEDRAVGEYTYQDPASKWRRFCFDSLRGGTVTNSPNSRADQILSNAAAVY